MLTWLTEEVDAKPLGLARIVVGGAVLIRGVLAATTLLDLADPDTLRIPYADWLPEPSLPLVSIVAGVWLLAGLAFMLGWKVAVTGPTLLGAIVVALSLDEQMYANHLYLMAWLVLLMTVADAGAGLSLSGRGRRVVRWPLLLLMSQASIVYFFAAVTKMNTDFFSGRVIASVMHNGLVAFPDSLRTPGILSSIAAVVVFVELFLAIFLWSSKLRPMAFLLGLALHLGITLLMASTVELLVFSLEMLALYPLFLSQTRLEVRVDPDCEVCGSLIESMLRFDLLGKMSPIDDPDVADDGVVVTGPDGAWKGFGAVTRVLEHLVPWLWIAPILRLPPLSQIGDRLYRRRLAAEKVRRSENFGRQ